MTNYQEDHTVDTQLLSNILSVVDTLEHPPLVTEDGETVEDAGLTLNEYDEYEDEHGTIYGTYEQSAHDWISEQLDLEYTIDSAGRYLGGEVLVTVGGPTIRVDTRRRCVTGTWGSAHYERSYTDNIGLDDALAELFEMTRG